MSNCGCDVVPDVRPVVRSRTREERQIRRLAALEAAGFTERPRVNGVMDVTPRNVAFHRPMEINRTVRGARPFSYDGNCPPFITNSQLMEDCKRLVTLLPPDIEVVIGIARSGLCAATMVAMLLHRPLMILRQSKGDLIEGGNGWRLGHDGKRMGRAVLIDDTVMTGNSFKHVTSIAEKHFPNVITAAIYVNPHARRKPDIWAYDLPWPHILEWNIFNSVLTPHMAFDFDGIFCRDCRPEEDDDGEKYLNFLRTAEPLYYVRKTHIPMIVTARLEKYRTITLEWLSRHQMSVDELVMFPADSLAERRRQDIAAFKAQHFKRFLSRRHRIKPPLFVESDARQAERIAQLSGGVTVCPAAGRCYGK